MKYANLQYYQLLLCIVLWKHILPAEVLWQWLFNMQMAYIKRVSQVNFNQYNKLDIALYLGYTKRAQNIAKKKKIWNIYEKKNIYIMTKILKFPEAICYLPQANKERTTITYGLMVTVISLVTKLSKLLAWTHTRHHFLYLPLTKQPIECLVFRFRLLA